MANLFLVRCKRLVSCPLIPLLSAFCLLCQQIFCIESQVIYTYRLMEIMSTQWTLRKAIQSENRSHKPLPCLHLRPDFILAGRINADFGTNRLPATTTVATRPPLTHTDILARDTPNNLAADDCDTKSLTLIVAIILIVGYFTRNVNRL